MALIFIGLPFVVRTVQPVLQDLDPEIEEAAATLGARRWQTFCRVILPAILPALLTGFALAFARGLGEYGSVIFIAGNMPMDSEIVPLLIIIELEQYDYAGATVIGTPMLAASFLLLLAINLLQRWARTRKRLSGGTADARSAGLYPARAVTADASAPRHPDRHGARVPWPLPAAAAARRLRRGAAPGLGVYLAGITEPDALAAIRLTLWSRRSPCR